MYRVYLDRGWRLIQGRPRVIKRGKNRGKFEVILRVICQPKDGDWFFKPIRRIVSQEQLKDMA